ncbi:hypothetical protein [Actinokineospora sp. HUAS TT18]|uniref:hypothetical protein n=1 Tax=Actinokineospora sp. HUAS TT18 TaxID=3447451 RepID=UPI003F521038
MLPFHPLPWTLTEVLAMPEDYGQRIELIDGALVIRPSPDSRHQRVLLRLAVDILARVPSRLELLPGSSGCSMPRQASATTFLVDPAETPSVAVLFRLDGDEYVEVTSSKAGRLRFDEPFLADLDLP